MIQVLAVLSSVGPTAFLDRGLYKCCSVPLITRAILLAHQCTEVRKVAVFADSFHVLQEARKHKAFQIRSTTRLGKRKTLCEKAVAAIAIHEPDFCPDIVLYLNWRTPLARVDDYSDMIQMLVDGKADSAATVISRPVTKSRKEAKHWAVPLIWTEARIAKVCWVADLMKFHRLQNGRVYLHEIPRDRCLEVETKEDVKQVEKRLCRGD